MILLHGMDIREPSSPPPKHERSMSVFGTSLSVIPQSHIHVKMDSCDKTELQVATEGLNGRPGELRDKLEVRACLI